MRAFLTAICALSASAALAKPPVTSPRPEQRAVLGSVDVTRTTVIDRIISETAASAAPVAIAAAAAGLLRSPRPPARPARLKRPATVSQPVMVASAATARVPQSTTGAVCGDPEIRGSNLSRIIGQVRGCGVDAPVRVTSVAGVALSTGATMDCTTAKALKTWVEQGVKPNIGKLGGGVAGLKVAAHYSCRPRNNKAGAKISEHGKGHAIDISAVLLRNGQALSVLQGWPDARYGRIMRAMHRAACGPFGTVLGPNSDRYHQNHFHLDTARYRGGAYCR